MGTADRLQGNQIPQANANVTVTLAPPGQTPIVDQTARDAAGAAQADVDAHEATTHNTDTTARTNAATAQAAAEAAQTEIDDHEANHPSGGGGGGSTVERLLITMPASTYQHRIGTALYFGTGEAVWTAAYPAGHTLDSMTAAFKTGVVQRDTDFTTEIGPPCTEAIATQLWGYAPGGTIDEYRVDLTAGGIVLAYPSVTTLPANQRDGWFVRLTLVS